MKTFQTICAALLLLAATASAAAVDDSSLTTLEEEVADARIFFVNFTSSLIQVNATILAYALVALAIAGAIAVALWFLFVESQKSQSGGYGQSSGYGSQGYGSQGYQQYARSNNDAYDFNSFNIIQWISMLQDLYEKFDYNDLECQKRLICEVMREPEYYGAAAKKFKTGFQYAKYLEVLSLPDDMRELLDEYLDANSRSESGKSCDEFFKCPYSIKDSFKRNVSGENHL